MPYGIVISGSKEDTVLYGHPLPKVECLFGSDLVSRVEGETNILFLKDSPLRIEDRPDGMRIGVDHIAKCSYGALELIPIGRHNSSLNTSEASFRSMLETIQRRLRVLYLDHNIRQVIAVYDPGVILGKIEELHPCLQIIGVPIIPKRIDGIHECARRFYDDSGKVPIYDQIVRIAREELRIVVGSDKSKHFVALTPNPSVFENEVLIMPTENIQYFHEASKDSIQDLSRILSRLCETSRLGPNVAIGILTDYNDLPGQPWIQTEHASFRYSITLFPSAPGAFRHLTGISFNTVHPVDATKMLKL